ncbi:MULTISPECIES: hypothetical protein [Neisseria]|uniref:hypothetical protein n=1 Tax=Neisseria TaxID=482 RepID=UPI001071EA88|nr:MULTISPECIES: hypothetical protein [Neisseria]MBF0802957.1 hypothetical protein [Neisseria sp. 19428wB4_WF04]TFU44485.1 hypothetical protein E4T99_00995 [Neisseria sp. WF04]
MVYENFDYSRNALCKWCRFFDSGPGWGAAIGGTIGGRLGVLGGLAGAGIGHVIETTDYNAWGRNYINSVMSDINSGNIPAD